MCCKLKLSHKSYNLWLKRLSQVKNGCGVFFKVFMRVLGPIMFAGANLLSVSVIVILLFKTTPPLYKISIALYLMNLAFIFWGSTNILFNYWMCMLTPAGSPPPCGDPGDVFGRTTCIENDQKITKSNTNVQLSLGVYYKYCPICSCIKPPRAHHCR